MTGRVVVIAGSDPSGGAGVQADIKTVTALGGYAAAAITALTVQNTTGVMSVHPVEGAVVRDQISAVLGDIGADAIKVGMVGSAAAGAAILDGLTRAGWHYGGEGKPVHAPLVLDPVLAATSGDRLDSEGLKDFIRNWMLPKSFLVTPNADEAAELTGAPINSHKDQLRAGEALLELGAQAALVKGGHMQGSDVVDLLVTHTGNREFRNPRIETTSTHGTGCTLASAIATGLAQGMRLEAAIERAIRFVRAALEAAPGYGAGAGPLGHAAAARKF